MYRQTIRPLYAYVSRRCGGDRALAEDVVQETWLRAVDETDYVARVSTSPRRRQK